MSLEQQVTALVEASNNLTGAVNAKIGEIDQAVQDATDEFNRQIDEVIKSIPESLTNIYVNHETGNDNNTGLSSAAKLQTLDKALAIAATKKAVVIHLGRVSDAQNNPYYVYDKHNMNNIQLSIRADVNDGYTTAAAGSGLENEFYKVPKIVFTHKAGRTYVGSMRQDGGRLTFGSYRLSVNIEWLVTSGAQLAYDGNPGISQNETALVSFSGGCKVFLNCDTSGAYSEHVGFIESNGTIRGDFVQGIEDKSTALNNRFVGSWSSSPIRGTRLFVINYSGNRTLSEIVKDYSSFGSVPYTQIAQV